MTSKDRELLLTDLSGRVRYGVRGLHRGRKETLSMIGRFGDISVSGYDAWFDVESFKPYLRPMSSMTSEEEAELDKIDEMSSRVFFDDLHGRTEKVGIENVKGFLPDYLTLDWLNEHHFDYRGLIDKGLALEAPEDMY